MSDDDEHANQNDKGDESIVPPYPRASKERVPLAYARSGPDAQTAMTTSGRWAIGCFGYVVLTALWFYFVPQIARGDDGRAWGGWIVLTVALLSVSLYVRLHYRMGGFGYGILTALAAGLLIAVGLVLLIIATCSGKL